MKYEPQDIIAIAIGLGLIAFMISLMMEAIIYRMPLPDNRVSILKGLLDSMIAIISMYIGSKLKGKKNE